MIGVVVLVALFGLRCEAARLVPRLAELSLKTQLTTDPESGHPYRASGLVHWPNSVAGQCPLVIRSHSAGQNDLVTEPME